MQRKHIPGISDEAVVTDPDQIRIISNDQRFDRDFVEPVSLRDRMFLKICSELFRSTVIGFQ